MVPIKSIASALLGRLSHLTSGAHFLRSLGWKIPNSVKIDLRDMLSASDELRSAVDGDAETEVIVSTILKVLTSIGAAVNDIATAIDLSSFPTLEREFPRQVFDYLVVGSLRDGWPTAAGILETLGLARSTMVCYPADEPVRISHLDYELDPGAVGLLFSSLASSQLFGRQFLGFGVTQHDLAGDFTLYDPRTRMPQVLEGIEYLMRGLGMETRRTYFADLGITSSSTLEMQRCLSVRFINRRDIKLGLDINLIHPDYERPESWGFVIAPLASLSGAEKLDFGDDWQLEVSGNLDVGRNLRLLLLPGTPVRFDHIDASQLGEGTAKIELGRIFKTPAVIFGDEGGTRLDVGGVLAGMRLRYEQGQPSFGVQASVRKLHFYLDLGAADSFIQGLSSGSKLEGTCDLTLGVDMERGLYFEGTGGLELVLAMHLALGPIEITRITVGAQIAAGNLSAYAGVSFNGTLGPLQVAVDRIGAKMVFDWTADRSGEMGGLKLRGDFLPPKGAGLSIEAGPVRGGGFLTFDPDRGFYAGVLDLHLVAVGITAIGFIQTKNPDGSDGFSMVASLSVEFTPALQLGFGFTLNAVGGLVGINRTLDRNALRDGLKNHTLDSLLFPQDPIKNASRIITDMQTAFPAAEGHFVIAPMIKLGWASIVTVEVGIFLEIPKFDIILIGQAHMMLPTAAARLLEIHLDVLGILSFEEKCLEIQASIYDSRLLFLELSGDAAFRFSWGPSPDFGLSLGGFHPRFVPPAGFPALRRLRIAIGRGPFTLSCEVYFALTSNSLQFGARAELKINLAVIEVYGFVAFDALFIFSPFSFAISIEAGVAVRMVGLELLSLRLLFELSGPRPWRALGDAKLHILFWDVTVHFDVTWGDDKPELMEPVDPLPAFLQALADAGSLPATAAVPLLTTAKLSPLEPIEIRQKVLPLGVRLAKSGMAPVAAHDEVSLASTRTVSLVSESFARAQFLDLSDDEKLVAPAFEPMPAGLRIEPPGPAVDTGEIHVVGGFEEIVIADDTRLSRRLPLGPRVMTSVSRIHRTYTSPSAAARAAPLPKLRTVYSGFTIVEAHTLRAVTLPANEPPNDGTLTLTAAQQALDRWIAVDPARAGSHVVIASYEVAA